MSSFSNFVPSTHFGRGMSERGPVRQPETNLVTRPGREYSVYSWDSDSLHLGENLSFKNCSDFDSESGKSMGKMEENQRDVTKIISNKFRSQSSRVLICQGIDTLTFENCSSGF